MQVPRTDLCALCQLNTTLLYKVRSFDDDKKQALLQKSLEHLNSVSKERELLKNVIIEAKSTLPTETTLTLGRHKPCSFDGLSHYSFDFAQQIFVPHSSQQVGPIYLLTPYKIGLFGIMCEPFGKMVIYIILKRMASGKGSNVVISLLHHYFENFALGESKVSLNANNCIGQNKNDTMIQYLTWRAMKELHTDIVNSFLIVGHTKFSPDYGFGVFKKKFRCPSVNVWKMSVTLCGQLTF